MLINGEERIMAKGLQPPGPLLVVKKKLRTTQAKRLRIIVSVREAADELVEFFGKHNAGAEIDRAGNDFHVVVDLANFEDAE